MANVTLNNYPNIMLDQAFDLNIRNKSFLENETGVSEKSLAYIIPGPFICVFGIICNVLNLCVLSQKMLKDSPYTYLVALAISDLTLLSTAFIHMATARGPNTYIKAFFDIYIFFCVGNICFNASVWLVVALTIERMLFVIRPLKFRPSKIKARIWIVVIFIFCSIINVPRFFCFKVKPMKGGYYARGTPYRMSLDFYNVSWFHAVVISFIPFVIILVTNAVLMYGLYKANRDRVSLHSNQELSMRMDQRRLTRTLFAVVVVFFVCSIPNAFVEIPIAYSLFGKGEAWDEYVRSPHNQTLTYISNLLIFVNSSLNFVLYCSFNKKFRIATKTFFAKLPLYKVITEAVCSEGKTAKTSMFVSKRTMVTKI